MAKRLSYASALILAGILVAAPAGAIEDFPAKGPAHAVDNKPLTDLQAPLRHDGQSLSTMPEPAAWLMMVVGFGLLGAMSRRGDPHPLHDELGL